MKKLLSFLLTLGMLGSAQFAHPDIVPQIVSGLEEYVRREGLDSLSTLVGAAHT